MTDDLSLDLATTDAQAAEAAEAARDPWLVRRSYGWGASEVASLLLAYDPREDEIATARVYHREEADAGRHGVPRIVARKAGLAAPRARSRAMRVGSDRERDLLLRWAEESGETVYLADHAPREWYPLVDRECPELTATPDAWMRGPSDELVIVEGKCTADFPAALPWYWRVQGSAQIAAMAAAATMVVCGRGWITGADTSPIAWLIERDEDEIARIRRVARLAWEDVKRMRAAREKA